MACPIPQGGHNNYCRNLKIARHTTLSDAEYLKLKFILTSRDLLLYGPYAKVFINFFVRVFRQGTKYF